MTAKLVFEKQVKCDPTYFDPVKMERVINPEYLENSHKFYATHVNKGKKNAFIEIRKNFNSADIFIIVALNGWTYKRSGYRDEVDTKHNVRVSMNGPLKLTFEQFSEIIEAVEQAKEVLKNG